MLLPVTLPPVAAALLARCRSARAATGDALAHALWLRLTAVLGFAGVGFHAFGVPAQHGRLAQLAQNVLNGPPLPAPPSFTGAGAGRPRGAAAARGASG